VSIKDFEEQVRAEKLSQTLENIVLTLAEGEDDENACMEAFDKWANSGGRSNDELEVGNAWLDRAARIRETVLKAGVAVERNNERQSHLDSTSGQMAKVTENTAPETRVEKTIDLVDDVCNNRKDKRTTKKKKKKSKKARDSSSSTEESSDSSSDESTDDDRRKKRKNPNLREPLIFIDEGDIAKGMCLDRAGRKLQRKQQKIFFTSKRKNFQTTYQLEIKLPIGMSYGGALLILTQGRYPLQCFNTQEDFDPSGRKYSSVKDAVQKFAIPFDNLSDWAVAVVAFRETLVKMNKFEEEGLIKYEMNAMNKFREISNAHQTVLNGKAVAFQKFLIFETEVRNRVEDNDIYEWGDAEVWQEVATKYPNVREIATNSPFQPSEAWKLEDGTMVPVDSPRGRLLGTVAQFQIPLLTRAPLNLDDGFRQSTPRGQVNSGRGRGSGGSGRGSYQNRHDGNHERPVRNKLPCERYNLGTCNLTAEQCRFGHFCAQFRNDIGKGCGRTVQHAYVATHKGGAKENAKDAQVKE